MRRDSWLPISLTIFTILRISLADVALENASVTLQAPNSSDIDGISIPNGKPGLTGAIRKKSRRPLFGLTYSPWRISTNCSDLRKEMVVEDLTSISLIAENVQIHGFYCPDLAPVILNLTRQLGIGLLIRLPASDGPEYNGQVELLKQVIFGDKMNVSHVLAVAIGHMELAWGRMNETVLSGKIDKLRGILRGAVKVTTIDEIDNLVNRPITPHLDTYIISVDVQAIGRPPGASVRHLVDTVAEVRQKAKVDKKRIFVVDVGWPSTDSGLLPPGQMEFLAHLVCNNERVDRTPQIELFLESAFDQPTGFSWPTTAMGLGTAITRKLKPYVLQALYWDCAQTFPDWNNKTRNSTDKDPLDPLKILDSSSWVWAIALAGSGFAIMFSLLVYFWYRKRRAQKKLHTARLHFLEMRKTEGDGGTDTSSSPFTLSASISQSEGDSYLPIIEPHYQDLSFLVPQEWKIDLNALELKEIVGKGHFGIVQRADYIRDGHLFDVAVKRLHVGAGDVRQFVSEGMRMQVLRHPNVLNLIGITFTVTNLPMIITPFMARGDLHSFLKDQKTKMSTSQLTTFAQQIADGMRYLHNLKWIHRDLAARNCMLDESLVVKIADFGLCRCVNGSESYQSTQMFELPVKWMAPETLEKLEWTPKSDVWSYGVVLWEIMSGGREPYSEVALIELRAFVQQGGRLAKPDGCSETMYDLMQMCWQNDPNQRPTFDQIHHRLSTTSRRKSLFAFVQDLKSSSSDRGNQAR